MVKDEQTVIRRAEGALPLPFFGKLAILVEFRSR